jgi:hypothetical protein
MKSATLRDRKLLPGVGNTHKMTENAGGGGEGVSAGREDVQLQICADMARMIHCRGDILPPPFPPR